jgi:hypothetical protein
MAGGLGNTVNASGKEVLLTLELHGDLGGPAFGAHSGLTQVEHAVRMSRAPLCRGVRRDSQSADRAARECTHVAKSIVSTRAAAASRSPSWQLMRTSIGSGLRASSSMIDATARFATGPFRYPESRTIRRSSSCPSRSAGPGRSGDSHHSGRPAWTKKALGGGARVDWSAVARRPADEVHRPRRALLAEAVAAELLPGEDARLP